MRFRLLLIPVIALAILAAPFVAAGSDGEDEPTIFTQGLFTFETINDVRVAAIDYDNDNAEEVVEIPAEVEYDGETYLVTDLMCDFSSDNIIAVKISENVWNIPYPNQIRIGKNIEAYIVTDSNINLTSVDGVLFDDRMHHLIAYPKGQDTPVYLIPESVNIVGESAFEGSNNLYYVDMYGDGLTEIRTRAFYGCENLQYINNISDVNELPESLSIIDDEAFKDCTKFGTVKLPDNLRIVGESAFENTAMTSVNIPSRVIEIGPGAFGNCSKLTEITSDFNSKYIAKDNVLFESEKETISIVTYPAGKTDSEYTIISDVTSINQKAFTGTQYLKKVNLPNEMMIITSGAFEDCTSLEEIDLSRVVVIDTDAFWNCQNLKTVVLGNSLSTINMYAFGNCGLNEIVLPESVAYIGLNAFIYCKDLKSFTISDYSKATVYFNALFGCTSLEEINLLSADITLEEGSLNIADKEPITVKVIKPKKYSIPSNAVLDDLTELNIHDIGERPYPYENFIGVAICLLILYMIVRLFRKV